MGSIIKAILITIKPQYACEIMNGNKTIEVRKNTALANGIKKLIAEYGKARIYVAVSKIQRKNYHLIEVIDTDIPNAKSKYEIDYYIGSKDYLDYCYDGKVAFMFECEKVEDIIASDDDMDIYLHTNTLDCLELGTKSCLNVEDFENYLCDGGDLDDFEKGYAIHISNLTIFDKPKELYEFEHIIKYKNWNCKQCRFEKVCVYPITHNKNYKCKGKKPLTKAPQNFCYVEVDE